MADTQIKGTLSADESISGSLTANKGIDASLTPDEEVSGALEVKRTRSIPTNLDDLGDVNITSPQDGQVMKYNGLTDEWENANDEDSGVWGSITGTLSDQTDLQTALDAKIPSTEKGSNNGVATLDATGRVPSSQLPSFVDDVLEYASLSAFPATGEAGKIYVALDTNKMYRWSGSTYVEVSESLALGETTGTAYEGSKGKANADNISAIQAKIPSNASPSNKLATASDIIGKADKVQNATSGHFAGLDANGNLTDSGVTAADIVGVPEELLKDTVGWTGKNLIPFPYTNGGAGETWVTNGITYTVNADGSVDVHGTATNDAYFRCGISTDDFNPIWLENGKSYILSGSGSSSVNVRLRNSNNTGVINANVTDATYNCSSSGKYYVLLQVNSGATISHLVVYPMLRLASINDATYEPYHKPVSEWAYPRSEANILGAKNLIPIKYRTPSGVTRGVTYTVNDDMSITANGTATSSGSFNFNHPTDIGTLVKLDKNKTYICSDVAQSGVASNYSLCVRYYAEGVVPSTTNGTNVSVNQNNDYKVVITNAVYAYIYIYVWSGKTLNNITFKPLLRLASDSDNTYYPPAMTNKQLTDSKVSYEDNAVSGVHNFMLYPYRDTTKVLNGVTFTDNGDGTVTVVTADTGATAETKFAFKWRTSDNWHLPKGRYRFTGCPEGGGYDKYYITVNSTQNGSIVTYGVDYGNGIIFDKANDEIPVGSEIVIKSGTIITTPIVFKPLMALASDPILDFLPYAKTNRELTSDILSAQSDISTIQGKIPSGASSSNKFATASDITNINNKIPSGASSSNRMATASDITDINNKIPSGASSSNRMATASDITDINNKIPSGASSSNKMATASDITNINNKIPSNASSSNKLATQSQITSLAAADMHIYSYDTPTTSIAANSYKDVTIDGSSIFSGGEEMLGIVGYTFSGTTAQYLSLYNCTVGIGNQKIILGIHNSSGSAASTSVKLKIMYRNTQ